LQQQILDTAARLAAEGRAWVLMKDLADHAGARTINPVKQLLAKGMLVAREETSVQPRQAMARQDLPADTGAGLTLTAAQERAVQRLADSIHAGFSVHLLHGVTGSGKTEVYLRAIEHTKGYAIVLVPEIALTPQTEARFRARFGSAGVAVLHSGSTGAQRHEQWRHIRNGAVRIVVGARSAIFAPLPWPPSPGLPAAAGNATGNSGGGGIIIVDEEHEPSYKQDQLPRYHARDVAIKRAQILGIPIVLGSATPSLESYYNATVGSVQNPKSKVQGPDVPGTQSEISNRKSQISDTQPRYHLLRLPERVAGLKLPKVEIVDMREERRKRYQYTGKGGVHLLSLRLEAAIRQTVAAKGQVILLLNRRGYANYIACPDLICGWIKNCDYCDTVMVYHKDQRLPAGGVIRCHHCDAEQLLPRTCPVCGKKVTVFGLGTQRVEEELGRKFPGLRLMRMDSDAMRTAHDYHNALNQFRGGQIDVLLGTQMIAKGLDFPNVRLVGVVSGDTALHLPDFRASERTFQLIAQVAGRTGRGDHPGLVIVQTLNPQDPAITLASHHDYEGFAAREIAARQSVSLPPITRMARIVVRDRDHVACHAHARKLADALTTLDAQLQTQVRIRGPAECPIARIAEYHRQQVEMLAATPGTLQRLLTAMRNQHLLHADAHTAVDVDPVALM
jgi:primosomal protein N' (replication factor Y)